MFNFSNKNNKRTFIRVMVIILILAMVLPTAYALIASLLGK